ncbi:MAG: putative membrane protein [Paraglaciecola sp.]|jgi:uncharacterized membrane protein
MEPFFTNDAIVFGLLIVALAAIFVTSGSKAAGWQKFYKYIPALLLCYFIPAILHYPLGLIASEWFSNDLMTLLDSKNLGVSLDTLKGMTFEGVKEHLQELGVTKAEYKPFIQKSQLYFVASRYLLPASLVLLCLGIDFKGILNLGPKALIMFFAATFGIVIGGPIALFLILNIAPDIVSANPDEIWRGLSTVAGSWIGGGANQTAMKEIFEVQDKIFASMIVVDVVVANIWMGFLLYGAGVSDKVDKWLKADNSAITELKNKIEDYRATVSKIPTTTDVFMMLAVAFGAVAFAHWGSDMIVPFMKQFKTSLEAVGLTSLMSGFFWLIVIVTTIGLGLSFTKFRSLEGVGASRWGSVFIYILVATIGMHMNLADVVNNLGLFAIGIVWMLIHVTILLLVAKAIKAPFFFVAVGSQANVGGAASAPIVASAFSPSLAPVGVLMAVLGYALGTYGALICAYMMQAVSGGM